MNKDILIIAEDGLSYYASRQEALQLEMKWGQDRIGWINNNILITGVKRRKPQVLVVDSDNRISVKDKFRLIKTKEGSKKDE